MVNVILVHKVKIFVFARHAASGVFAEIAFYAPNRTILTDHKGYSSVYQHFFHKIRKLPHLPYLIQIKLAGQSRPVKPHILESFY